MSEPNFSLAAYKALRTIYRATGSGNGPMSTYMRPDECSMATLYELYNLHLIEMDSRSPRRVHITDYGRRVYFECDTPQGAEE